MIDSFTQSTNAPKPQCGIAVLHGPSAGRAWRYPEPGARSFAASRKEANAEINGITAISPEVIAYISTLVRSSHTFGHVY